MSLDGYATYKNKKLDFIAHTVPETYKDGTIIKF